MLLSGAWFWLASEVSFEVTVDSTVVRLARTEWENALRLRMEGLPKDCVDLIKPI
jgi:hypothetical protein